MRINFPFLSSENIGIFLVGISFLWMLFLLMTLLSYMVDNDILAPKRLDWLTENISAMSIKTLYYIMSLVVLIAAVVVMVVGPDVPLIQWRIFSIAFCAIGGTELLILLFFVVRVRTKRHTKQATLVFEVLTDELHQYKKKPITFYALDGFRNAKGIRYGMNLSLTSEQYYFLLSHMGNIDSFVIKCDIEYIYNASRFINGRLLHVHDIGQLKDQEKTILAERTKKEMEALFASKNEGQQNLRYAVKSGSKTIRYAFILSALIMIGSSLYRDVDWHHLAKEKNPLEMDINALKTKNSLTLEKITACEKIELDDPILKDRGSFVADQQTYYKITLQVKNETQETAHNLMLSAKGDCPGKVQCISGGQWAEDVAKEPSPFIQIAPGDTATLLALAGVENDTSIKKLVITTVDMDTLKPQKNNQVDCVLP